MVKKLGVLFMTVALLGSTVMGCGQNTSKSGSNDGKESSSAAVTSEAKQTAESSAEETSGLIGIALPAADHGWVAGTIYYAEQKCKSLGLDEGGGYKIVTSANVNEQANQIDELIAQKCSAIVLLPHNDEVSVAAQKIIDAGIKLIVFDRKVTGDYTAYVAGNNAGIGTSAAKYLGDKLGGKGIVAVMSAPSVGSVSVERTEAFEKEMAASYPDVQLIEVSASGFTQEAGLSMATDMLVANPQIDAVFSIDDEPSLGILQAVKDANRTDVKYISGGGGAQSWYSKIQKESDISCFTETYSPSMISDAIQAAKDILDGKYVPKDTIIEPSTVDSSNVADFINSDSPY
ncbi:substrate-binding domain-containing protein [Lachnospiraceae bacterium 54-53]